MEVTQSFRLMGSADIVKITIKHVDGQNVVHWEDIEQVFPGVGHIQNSEVVVKSLRDSNQIRVVPRCIKHCPGVVLDVVLTTTIKHALVDSPMASPNLALANGLDQADTAKAFQEMVKLLGGSFDERIGWVKIDLRSRMLAGQFYLALEKAMSVYELKIRLTWETTYSDFEKLQDTLQRTRVRVLEIDCTEAVSTSDVLDCNERYDPILAIMRHPLIQEFKMTNAPKDFLYRSSPLPDDANFPNLKCLAISQLDTESDCTKLISLVSQAPNLSCLSLKTSSKFFQGPSPWPKNTDFSKLRLLDVRLFDSEADIVIVDLSGTRNILSLAVPKDFFERYRPWPTNAHFSNLTNLKSQGLHSDADVAHLKLLITQAPNLSCLSLESSSKFFEGPSPWPNNADFSNLSHLTIRHNQRKDIFKLDLRMDEKTLLLAVPDDFFERCRPWPTNADFSSLTNLEFQRFYSDADVAHLKLLFTQAPNLSSLSLESSSKFFEGPSPWSNNADFSNLRHLTIQHNQKEDVFKLDLRMDEKTLLLAVPKDFFERCRPWPTNADFSSLTNLEFQRFYSDADVAHLKLLFTQAPNLSSLSLESSSKFFEGLSPWSNNADFSNLRHLTIQHNQKEDVFKLDLRMDEKTLLLAVPKDFFERCRPWPTNADFSSLTNLEFQRFYSDAEVAHLKLLFTQAPNLSSLSLESSSKFFEGPSPWSNNADFSNLRHLTIQHNQRKDIFKLDLRMDEKTLLLAVPDDFFERCRPWPTNADFSSLTNLEFQRFYSDADVAHLKLLFTQAPNLSSLSLESSSKFFEGPSPWSNNADFSNLRHLTIQHNQKEDVFKLDLRMDEKTLLLAVPDDFFERYRPWPTNADFSNLTNLEFQRLYSDADVAHLKLLFIQAPNLSCLSLRTSSQFFEGPSPWPNNTIFSGLKHLDLRLFFSEKDTVVIDLRDDGKTLLLAIPMDSFNRFRLWPSNAVFWNLTCLEFHELHSDADVAHLKLLVAQAPNLSSLNLMNIASSQVQMVSDTLRHVTQLKIEFIVKEEFPW